MAKKVLTQDERALKFFFDTNSLSDLKLTKRGAKVVALSELPELNAFGFIEVSLKNGERWTMRRDDSSGEVRYIFQHSDPVGDLIGDVVVTPKAEESAELVPVAPAIVVDPAEAAASVDRIRSELTSVLSSFCRIGYEFIQVRDKQLFRAYGYKDLAEFGEKLFDLKRASMYNYIKVCERFSRPDGDGNPTAEISSAFADYSFTQLTEIMRLPEGKAALVTPEMSCKDIRALKSEDDSSEASGAEPNEYTDTVNLFCRTLTKGNLKSLMKELEQYVGRVVTVDVEIPMKDGEIVPVSA